MMKKIVSKIIASMLVLIMLLAYTATIGIYAKKVYATENTLEVQGVKTNNENVEFDAYFVNGKTKTHEIESKIGEGSSIYLSIAVKNAGYLKNAKVEFEGNEENSNANFLVKELTQANQAISAVNTTENYIELNQINKNEQANIQIPICFDNKDKISLNEFSKENIAKLTGTYVDANGKEKQIKAQIKIKLDWTQDTEIALEEQIVKYIPYTVDSQNGVIMQTVVRASVLNNNMPVKEENIEITVPTIANTKPTSVNVAANTTKAINGDENAVAFTKDDYTYDETSGKITITVKNNVDEQGNITWNKNAQDEFIVTYLYPQEILNNMPQDGNKVQLETKANITTYGAKENTLTKTITSEALLKDNISSIVNIEVATNVEQLSKGYIYANYEAEEKIETEYKEIVNTNIGSRILTDNIVLYSNVDNFVKYENTKGATTVNNTNYAYIKELKIEKEIYDKFIGEEGYINLYQASTLISTINKDTQVTEDKNIVVDLSEFNINELTIITSKPLVEGNLKIELTKALKGDIGYSKSQMKAFTALEVNASLKAMNNGIIFDEQSASKNINFTEPKSTAEISINNESLSTVVTNKDVELRAILKTNSLDYNLYKNPSITITMPSYIESMTVKSAQVLFDDELKIQTANLVENEDGTKAVVLQLEGTQTKYNIGNIAGGTNIVITADIDVNKLTPNTKAEIKMNYTNENTIQETASVMRARSIAQAPVEQNEASTVVGFTAPTGIVTMNGIAGYKEGAEELTSISGEEKIATIDIMSASKEATFNMSVMNNYNNTIENVVILGRTPFAGNKEIITAKDLSSTMNLGLTTPITVNGIDSAKVAIYYSENGEATTDLNNSANGWTQTITDLSKVKSYLIVTNNYVMNTADSITFTYNALIPENLQHNQSAYETYAVYFTNNLETGIIEDKQETAKVGVTTGKGPVLEAEISANVEEGETVLSDSQIIYTVTVKNTGDLPATNLKITLPVPEGTEYRGLTDTTIYCENGKQTTKINQLNVNETIEKKFAIVAKRLEENPDKYCTNDSHFEITKDTTETGIVFTKKEHKADVQDDVSSYRNNISVQAVITYNELEKEISTNILTNNIKNTNFKIEQKLSLVEEINESEKLLTNLESGEILLEGETLLYDISIKNYYNTNNTILETYIPIELEYTKVILETIKDGEEEIQDLDDSKVIYDKNTGKLQIKGLNGKVNSQEIVHIYTKVKETKEEMYNKEIKFKAYVLADGIDAEYTNEFTTNIIKNTLKITQTSSIPEGEIIADQEIFVYKILIESIGKNIERSININLKDKLPKELGLDKVTRIVDKNEEKIYGKLTEDNNLNISTEIQEGQSQQICIYVHATRQEEDIKIVNEVEASIGEKTIEVNSISHTIKATDYENINNSDENKHTRKISGQVWIDENKDGIKDKDEQRVQNIQVMLLNKSTGNLQKDTQITTEEGKYAFTGVPKGKYTVIFLYDTANYSSTSYRKDGVDSTVNSDAIDIQITLDGIKRTAAITEEIVISDSNIYNIDLGLVVNPKFDLKLDKTVSKITVQDSTGTKTYDYEDTKLAKRDLIGKQINSTTIVVEYKIKVTNEGAVSGYVKKIADYVPSELKFSSELNKDWYEGQNGTIYNASLANTLINPGETKEVTLLLTKKLSEENIGLIHNSAEIYEAYNDLGLEDIDSTPGNKQTDEDDQSSADVLLTVKTGETILFIGLTLGIISTIAIGAYVIKRKIIG